jgi:hypothetical protein
LAIAVIERLGFVQLVQERDAMRRLHRSTVGKKVFTAEGSERPEQEKPSGEIY